MMDRATIQLCNMQMGFVEFVVAPLIITFIKILPPLHEIGVYMADNYCCWGEKRKLEIKQDAKITNKEEEIGKLDARMTAFKGKFTFLDELKALPTRKTRDNVNSGKV